MKSVLILTSNVGGGHLSPSHALKQIILKHSPSTQVTIKNTSLPGHAKVSQLLITKSIQTQVKAYHQTNHPEWVESFSKIYQTYTIPVLSLAIHQTKPDLIICTNSLSALGLKPTLEFINQKIPYIVTVIDPFSIHHLWTHNHDASAYFAPTQQTKTLLIKQGIQKEKIKITGYPIRSNFYKRNNPPSKKVSTIFLGGSGSGDHALYDATINLAQQAKSLSLKKIIVATGKNRSIRKKLDKEFGLNHPIIKTIGYSVRLDWYMSLADIVIGKPGPNFLFESILLNKPLIASGICMGNEEGNAAFIINNHIGLTCADPHQLPELIRSITPQKLASFHQHIAKIRSFQVNTPARIWRQIKPFLSQPSHN